MKISEHLDYQVGQEVRYGAQDVKAVIKGFEKNGHVVIECFGRHRITVPRVRLRPAGGQAS